MEILSTIEEVRAFCESKRLQGKTIGFVPTMGFLHEGHLSLMRKAKEHADHVVVSIFVNPTQFGPNEDLDRYPRDPEGDADKCRSVGVDMIFTPPVDAMYPQGEETIVDVLKVSQGLCGEHRPGHFRGVTTIVEKLFNVVGPCVAVFGEKDYQQLAVIRAMTRDLLQPIKIVSGPIVREKDGIAMSSRNVYLSADEREQARVLNQSLFALQKKIREGEKINVQDALNEMRLAISDKHAAKIDYIDVRKAEDLARVNAEEILKQDEYVILVAVFFGKTRLIDNLVL